MMLSEVVALAYLNSHLIQSGIHMKLDVQDIITIEV